MGWMIYLLLPRFGKSCHLDGDIVSRVSICHVYGAVLKIEDDSDEGGRARQRCEVRDSHALERVSVGMIRRH